MKENVIIQYKSYNLALKIIALYRSIKSKQGEQLLLQQLLRCGTSIGVNIEEAEGEATKKDFITKITISFKEARKCCYWLRLLTDSGIVKKEDSQPLIEECVELLKILKAILKTSKATKTGPTC